LSKEDDEMVEVDSEEEISKACERFGIDFDSLGQGKKKEIRKKAKHVIEQVS